MSSPAIDGLACFQLPDDFAARAAAVRQRIDAGELIELDALAEALGLPLDFIVAALGVAEVLRSGRPVLIVPPADDAPPFAARH